jgi:hypothetical protein
MTGPEAFTVTRYRCPFCRRSWQNKARAEGHIAVCWYNHGCKTCRHADLIDGAYVDGCELGVDLRDPESMPGEPPRILPRSQCPLWEGGEDPQ